MGWGTVQNCGCSPGMMTSHPDVTNMSFEMMGLIENK